MKILNLFVVLSCLFVSSLMAAELPGDLPKGNVVFFVSAVLKKANEATTIKLVHSIELTNSEKDAIASFSRKVKKDHPSFLILDLLATPSKIPDCGTSI